MKKYGLIFVFAILAASLAPARTFAVTAPGPRHLSYVIAYEPLFGVQHIPYAGWLQLTVNGGILSGTYRGLSITPDDPFVGRITSVSGGMSADAIHFDIGSGPGSLSFNGRVLGNWFDGTAKWRGRFYRLSGEIGRPRGM